MRAKVNYNNSYLNHALLNMIKLRNEIISIFVMGNQVY
jgi:hypothetical protein